MDSPLEPIHFGIPSFGRQSRLGGPVVCCRYTLGMVGMVERGSAPAGEERWGFEWKDHQSWLASSSNRFCYWTRVNKGENAPSGPGQKEKWMMVPIQNPCLCTERLYIYIYVVHQSKPHINLDQFRFRHTKAVFWGRKTCSCFMAWRFPLNIQALWSSIALAYAEFFGNRCASKRWFWHPCWFWNYMKLCIDMISEPWIMNSLKMAHNMSLTRGDVIFFWTTLTRDVFSRLLSRQEVNERKSPSKCDLAMCVCVCLSTPW